MNNLEKEFGLSEKSTELAERAQKLDSDFFKDFETVGLVEAHAYLDGDKKIRAQQQTAFLSGEIENPDLDYPKIDLDKFTSREKKLRELKKKVRLSVDDSNEAAFIESREARVVRQAYLWRINESIATIGMLRAAQEGDMRRFEKYNHFIYGEPSVEIFDYTLSGVRETAEQALESEDENIITAAKDLLSSLPEPSEEVEISEPSQEDFKTAKKATKDEFSDVIKSVPESKDFQAIDIKQVFVNALDDMSVDTFEVVIDKESSRSGLAVMQEDRQVVIPEGRQLSEDKMKSLLVHEIGTHVLRRELGQRSRLELLSLGLDRYEKGEEGVAKIREQTLADEFCVRTFRGSDCQTPGACYTKDIAYREGQIGVWQVVADSPEEVRRFSVGKYDPANDRHVWILDQLGITDDDLEELEK